jgi:hypothetical protein
VPRRIDVGDVLAALGALLVWIGLFGEWFGGANGWEAFESLDLVLAALAAGALGAAAAGAGLLTAPSPRLLAPAGAVLLVIVVVQLMEPPPAFSEDDELGTGAWLGLVGAALVLLGGLLRVARVSVSVSVGGRDVRRRVPAVDRRSTLRADSPGDADDAPHGGAVAGSPAASAPPAATAGDDPQPTQPFSAVEER